MLAARMRAPPSSIDVCPLGMCYLSARVITASRQRVEGDDTHTLNTVHT
jgi:hypothetical protein